LGIKFQHFPGLGYILGPIFKHAGAPQGEAIWPWMPPRPTRILVSPASSKMYLHLQLPSNATVPERLRQTNLSKELSNLL